MTKFEFAEEQFFLTTVLLEVTSETGGQSLGTGFFVRWDVPGGAGKSVVVVVTCRHVLCEGRGTVSFRMHRARHDDPALPDLDDPVRIAPGPYGNTYFAHDDPSVDVAALNVSMLFATHRELYQKFLQRQDFADFETDTLGPNMRAVFIGYPVGLHDERHALPILRAGTIASIPKVDFNGKPIFLIDAQVFPGSSGSPVIVETGGDYKLVGLVTSAYERSKDVFTAKAPALAVMENLGLGVVFKVKAIGAVLDKVAASTITH